MVIRRVDKGNPPPIILKMEERNSLKDKPGYQSLASDQIAEPSYIFNWIAQIITIVLCLFLFRLL